MRGREGLLKIGKPAAKTTRGLRAAEPGKLPAYSGREFLSSSRGKGAGEAGDAWNSETVCLILSWIVYRCIWR
jgi:hypothetical protein